MKQALHCLVSIHLVKFSVPFQVAYHKFLVIHESVFGVVLRFKCELHKRSPKDAAGDAFMSSLFWG